MLSAFSIRVGWTEVFRRAFKSAIDDDVLGLAAQLSYYFFLALFPALLFLVSLASFFPLHSLVDDLIARAGPFVPEDLLRIVTDQLTKISERRNGGLLTLGFLFTLWSTAAGVVAVITALNRTYDIADSRPWWKVRLVALALTVAVGLFVLISTALVLVGPQLAGTVAGWFGLGAAFELTWKIAQWPIVFGLVVTGIGMVYYFGPDAEQEWVWITPGSLLATLLWLIGSLGFRFYVTNFASYNATYGAIGGVIVALLWLYITGVAILMGAELNAEIEHASPYGKEPGEKRPGEKKKIRAAAARAWEEAQREGRAPVGIGTQAPNTVPAAAVAQASLDERRSGQRRHRVRRHRDRRVATRVGARPRLTPGELAAAGLALATEVALIVRGRFRRRVRS
jgi:membrane protein